MNEGGSIWAVYTKARSRAAPQTSSQHNQPDRKIGANLPVRRQSSDHGCRRKHTGVSSRPRGAVMLRRETFEFACRNGWRAKYKCARAGRMGVVDGRGAIDVCKSREPNPYLLRQMVEL